MKQWSGRAVGEARAVVAQWLPAPCGQECGDAVTVDDDWVVGHKKSRHAYPELTWMVDNWQPEHRHCSDRSGHAARIEKRERFFPASEGSGSPRPFPHTHTSQAEPLEVREALLWTNPALSSAPWLSDVLEVPGDASAPLAMTPPHPDAVGSYGAEAIQWVKDETGVDLRWWQRLAFLRQLEHDVEGRLLWRTIVESGPRRVGKSVRLRSMALWRLDHADLFGEKQLALHTGKDVAIVREIHRQAWRWAQEREDWDVRRGVGQEEVFTGDHRWLVRSTDSVYGYDVCLGMVDEAWAVDPPTFEEGLEPATMERVSPQLLLTSTAHRRATSLMRKKITSALATEDGETLLMLWAAPPEADPHDPATWRAASPHWSEDRRRMIAAKLESALSGQADAEADDPDPFEGFLAQYLNRWRLNAKAPEKGTPLVTDEVWETLTAAVPDRTPDAAAIEDAFTAGVSVALTWRAVLDESTSKPVVRVFECPDVATAAAAIKATGYRGVLPVGASIAEDPALKGMRPRAMKGRTVATVQDWSRLLSDDAFRHDGGELLRQQILTVRTVPGVDGPRLVSRSRTDALKAAAWALHIARAKNANTGKPRVLLPSAH